MFEGQLNAKILVVNDYQRVSCRAEGIPMGEYLLRPLLSAAHSAGLRSSEIMMICIHRNDPKRLTEAEREIDLKEFAQNLATSEANVVVPLGEYCLRLLTGLASITKWHCSIIKSKAEYGFRKCVPLYHPEHVMKVYADSAYLTFGMMRIKDESLSPTIETPSRDFILGPDLRSCLDWLGSANRDPAAPLAIDIETGGGLINTVGFADSARNAIAIKSLPEFYSPADYLALWQAIAKVLEGPRPKVLQNFIYEATWFARYGIELKNTVHDTMWAMKFLHPEFEKGLDNVGRLYTTFPYWKDDNDDWANIRDWARHLDYNCKDTTGTFAAFERQVTALKDRELYGLFADYIMRFAPPIQEMCASGLHVDTDALVALKDRLCRERDNYMRIIDDECMAKLNRKINPRSPAQVKTALKEMKFKLPIHKGKESTDKKSLVKLRRKYPDAAILQALIGLSKTNKQLSSYVEFEYDRKSNRVHYSLDGCGTETGRWSGHNSGWGEGFNPQTVPKSVRNCFKADDGFVLVQIDLAQAESRYVAWEAPEPKLMEMLESGRDVHKFVASKIFHKPEEIINKVERQLGKKSGHSANYSVGPRTFAEACLVEMDLAMEEAEARRIIETYFEVFPGIRVRQANIKREIMNKRMLKTPIGRERHFYGRMNDATFREGYAYAPQSTIPDITNHLMLYLWESREYLDIDRFLLQVHDSLLIQVPPARVNEIRELVHDLKAWHPKIQLPGGELWIPVEVEVGHTWGRMEVI